MSEKPLHGTNASDEIDMGQLLGLIKKCLKSLGNMGLRIFLFFKKNMLILLGLLLLGFGISYGLSQVISKKLKSEVIVRPNFESTDYLIDVVEELKTNLITKNDAFFKSLGINMADTEGFEIVLEAILDDEEASDEKVINQMRYLETLNNFKDQGFAMDILRSELAETSVTNYKISFLYHDAKKGPEVAKILLEYINTNEYFNEIKEVYTSNARSRIFNNTKLVAQIDDVVANFSNSLKPSNIALANQGLYADKEPLNVQSLLNLKKKLNEDIEQKNLEIKQQADIISVLNYGNTQEIRKPFFENRTFMIPLILVLGFLAFRFVQYLNAKSKEFS